MLKLIRELLTRLVLPYNPHSAPVSGHWLITLQSLIDMFPDAYPSSATHCKKVTQSVCDIDASDGRLAHSFTPKLSSKSTGT